MTVSSLLAACAALALQACETYERLGSPEGELAIAQAVFVYLPDNARAKLVASGVMAVGGGITAAVTDGISQASVLVVLTQLAAWVAAGAVANGARPDVVLGEAVGKGVHQ